MPSDHHSYHVRVGSMGELWHCGADASQYRRGERVVCRTPRGLEIGTVTAPGGTRQHPFDGRILRRTTTEDELLEARLLRYKQQAVESCRREIAERGLAATLIDVDHLFDGRTLIFYFLGEIGEELQELSDALSERYEQRVRSKHFAKLLAEGCGPGCGTESRGGCGTSGGCAVCLAASACAKA
ncbi:PSP1 family protein [Candidatus Laterigemmans baculatus]|uniref:PSP1 family protein n=1 Tax=Candidatus Laterigemmans baculatus TaxID=2770505 RepID=UPI0013DD70B4|nr:PSP1 domain-containing protein [Candidatus Laterigemmans baculatus]